MMHLTHNDILSILPDRDPNAHKGNFGRILLLCGGRGYTGAAALAGSGALRTGAGLVFMGVPESIYAIEAIKMTEAIVFPMRDENGMFAPGVFTDIQDRLKAMDAVLIGPGLGKSAGCEELVCRVLETFRGPVILDADGINLMIGHKDIIRRRDEPTILTPHCGEFTRFVDAGISPDENGAISLANNLGAIIVLKGHNTVITDGNVTYVNNTGNPGMAVGGSGDVLAGMIASLIGQKIDPLLASASAVWLHGRAGDLCADDYGQYWMLPSDMLRYLPQLMK